MPTFHFSYNLNDADDVDELIMKFDRLVKSLKGDKGISVSKDKDSRDPISLKELCKRLKKRPQTIATYRCKGMPYLSGRPCTYIYDDCYKWYMETRGMNGGRK